MGNSSLGTRERKPGIMWRKKTEQKKWGNKKQGVREEERKKVRTDEWKKGPRKKEGKQEGEGERSEATHRFFEAKGVICTRNHFKSLLL